MARNKSFITCFHQNYEFARGGLGPDPDSWKVLPHDSTVTKVEQLII